MSHFAHYVDEDVIFLRDLNPNEVQIPEFNRPLTVITFCNSGYMRVRVGDMDYELRAGDVYICPTGIPVYVVSSDPDTKIAALCMTDRIIQALLQSYATIWNQAIYVDNERFFKRGSDVIDPDKAELGRNFSRILDLLLRNRENPFRKEMVYLVLQMMLLGYCAHQKGTKDSALWASRNSEYSLPNPDFRLAGGSSERIFNQFLTILNAEQIKHRPVAYYAEKLNISAKYLSYVCKKVSGKLASEFIKDAVTGQIIHYLENTSLTTKEISTLMGFDNISFFGKFVKARLGLSPNNYRANARLRRG